MLDNIILIERKVNYMLLIIWCIPTHSWTPFFGSLKFQYLDVCTLQSNKVVKEARVLDGLGRLRSVKQGPDGYIYAGVENLGIVKLIPKN